MSHYYLVAEVNKDQVERLLDYHCSMYNSMVRINITKEQSVSFELFYSVISHRYLVQSLIPTGNNLAKQVLSTMFNPTAPYILNQDRQLGSEWIQKDPADMMLDVIYV